MKFSAQSYKMNQHYGTKHLVGHVRCSKEGLKENLFVRGRGSTAGEI